MKKVVTIWNCMVPGKIIDRPELKGHIRVDEHLTRDDIFELCNWECHMDECPEEMANIDISSIGSGLLLFMDNKYHLSLPVGWLETEFMNNDLEHAIYLLQRHKILSIDDLNK